MSKDKLKPLKAKTKQIDKDLNKAYKNDEGVNNLKEDSKAKDIENEKIVEENTDIDEQEQEEKVNDLGKDDTEIEKLKKENQRLKDLLSRKAAELDNILKRTIKEKNDLIEYANESLLFKFLPLMDDFAKAIESSKQSKDYDSLLKGIEMIYQKTKKTMDDVGVKKMEINKGDDFDVEFHEAMMKMPSKEVEEDKIIQVAEDGYLYKDKVLRHAKVITSSGNQNN